MTIGRFHEIGLATADIRASVEFYEALGFVQAPANDTWPHPYGVLTDGRLVLGLHQRPHDSATSLLPALTFVLPDVALQIPRLEALGIVPTFRRTSADEFNAVGFRDPGGQDVTLIEARTYSPVAPENVRPLLCGEFAEYSMPESDFERAREFWERLGFVATDDAERPWPSLSLTSDHIDLAFHRGRTLDAPMLVFLDKSMAPVIRALRDRGIETSDALPRGLDAEANAMIEAPEGTALLLLSAPAEFSQRP